MQILPFGKTGATTSARLKRWHEAILGPYTTAAGAPAAGDLALQRPDGIAFGPGNNGNDRFISSGNTFIRALGSARVKYAVLVPTDGIGNYTRLFRSHTNGNADVRGLVNVANHRVAPTVLAGAADAHPGLAFVSEAVIRKVVSTDTPGCGVGFGFMACSTGYGQSAYNSNLQPLVGLIGDGAGGFRFGSVGCPRGVVAARAVTYADANAVQPDALVAPGAAEFRVRIKVIPPIDASTPAAWVAYLDGALVATFGDAANWPLGDNTETDRDGWGLTPLVFADSLAAASFGIAVRDWRSWWTEDLTTDYDAS